jgi:hypothetical protein
VGDEFVVGNKWVREALITTHGTNIARRGGAGPRINAPWPPSGSFGRARASGVRVRGRWEQMPSSLPLNLLTQRMQIQAHDPTLRNAIAKRVLGRRRE